jgi:electron transfer flavoprotein beta subunit
MKILVPVKRVVDYNVRIRVKSDNSGVELGGVKMSMNPFDEIAVEEALRLREAGIASEVTVVSIGADAVVETLRAALAMGADKAIHLKTDAIIQPLLAAKLIQTQAVAYAPDMVILGKQAIDDDAAQTGQMLAGLLGWGQATFASKLVIENGQAVVTREVDGGAMVLSTPLPCVVTTDLRLNQPRYASLPNIMKARSKPIETLDAATLGVDITPRLEVLRVDTPPKRKGGIKVASVDALLEKLKYDAKVLPV